MVKMGQKNKADRRDADKKMVDEIFNQDYQEKTAASEYNEMGRLGDFVRKYKPFENGEPVIMDFMKFYNVKLKYAKELMRQKASGQYDDPYTKSLYMLDKIKTPQTVNFVSYMMKIGVGKSGDQKDSEIVLALEACRDTFDYINERSRK